MGGIMEGKSQEAGVMAEGKILRLDQFAQRVGYKPSTIRKMLFRREISFFKPGRIILIPESEVARLLGRMRRAVVLSDEAKN